MLIYGDKPIIFANGCFDILHVGHYKFLEFCKKTYKALGSQLMISLDSDKKIKKDKGKNRPIFNLTERQTAIRLLFFDMQDKLTITSHNSNEELEELIKNCSPILIESEYWKGNVIGEKYAKGIIFFPVMYTPTTTDIVKRVLDKHS